MKRGTLGGRELWGGSSSEGGAQLSGLRVCVTTAVGDATLGRVPRGSLLGCLHGSVKGAGTKAFTAGSFNMARSWTPLHVHL